MIYIEQIIIFNVHYLTCSELCPINTLHVFAFTSGMMMIKFIRAATMCVQEDTLCLDVEGYWLLYVRQSTLKILFNVVEPVS